MYVSLLLPTTIFKFTAHNPSKRKFEWQRRKKSLQKNRTIKSKHEFLTIQTKIDEKKMDQKDTKLWEAKQNMNYFSVLSRCNFFFVAICFPKFLLILFDSIWFRWSLLIYLKFMFRYSFEDIFSPHWFIWSLMKKLFLNESAEHKKPLQKLYFKNET